MFRFSIRDLLWLTLVVAMGLGWLAREQHLEARWRSAVQIFNDQYAEVQRGGWGLVNTLQDAIEQHGYVVFWNMDMTRVILRSPDGTETVYKVLKFTHPNAASK